jgi:hypothetical protein
MQVPDVVTRFSAYITAARVASGDMLNNLFIFFANVKETAAFEGRSKRREYKWSGEKNAGVMISL